MLRMLVVANPFVRSFLFATSQVLDRAMIFAMRALRGRKTIELLTPKVFDERKKILDSGAGPRTRLS
jgi:hypothetical protein